MEKIEICVEAMRVKQGREIQLSRAIVDRFRWPVPGWIGMHDALRQGLARPQQNRQEGRHT
jgi:uncharacterized protein (DUF4415 family)